MGLEDNVNNSHVEREVKGTMDLNRINGLPTRFAIVLLMLRSSDSII